MQVDITADQRSDAGQSRFPRLKLQANERARIVIVSKAEKEWVHRLEAPNIVNMAPTYKKIKNRDGQDIFVVETRFIGAPICSGDSEILKERGVDDKGCQACEMARDRPDIFRSPQPKYAVNVLKYGLRPGGSWNDIASPYGVNALIWVFGNKVIDKLVDIRALGPAYDDLRTVDLLLKCGDEKDVTFQKPYSNGEFDYIAPAVWLANDATRKYTAEYLASNGASSEDLAASIGRRVKADWLADDINRVIQRWDVVRAYESRQGGAPAVNQDGFGAETLQQAIAVLQQQAQGGGSTSSGQQPQGFVPSGPQGYAGSPSAGVDMSLLGGQGGSVAPPPSPSVQSGESSPSTVPGWSVPPTVPSATAPAPSTAPDTSALPATAASPPVGLEGLKEFMAKTTSNPSMEAAPSVPHDQLVPPSSPPPAAPAAQSSESASPTSGGSWSFDELAKMGQQ